METTQNQCGQMATAVKEFCSLIDHLNSDDHEHYWLRRMEKVLPRLHSAVVSLDAPETDNVNYNLPNDELRCELFMRINQLLLSDGVLWSDFDKSTLKQDFSERLADDFTDMYFDLKRGLDLLDQHPENPSAAASNWRNSFYLHWGEHLVDAEGWLHAVEVRNFGTMTEALKLVKEVKKAKHH